MGTSELTQLRRRCLLLVDEHFTDPRVGPRWLAARLYTSRRHLGRAFEGGIGVAESLAVRRLVEVVALISAQPDLPLAEIARRSGYSSYETLRWNCHRRLTMPPSTLRALVLAGSLTAVSGPGSVDDTQA